MMRFSERLYPKIGQWFEVDEIAYALKTEFFELSIFRNPVVGRVLALDGIVQTTEGDEFVYHEMLSHVPILAHGAARRVLIVGGGDGGMAEEVLKHRSVEEVVMVEIDQGVIDMSKQHLPAICGNAFEDPRLTVIIDDAANYVAAEGPGFDVIISDATDPIGPGESLFERSFYTNCRRRLAPGGILVTQNGVPFFQPEELANTHAFFKELFADPWFYVAAVPTYYGGFMALGWASDEKRHRQTDLATLAARYQASGIATRYYTPGVHWGAFQLPGFMLDLIAGR
ncbi:MAG: polyamine aminopropyltransferase [Thalassobaculales bacterium]